MAGVGGGPHDHCVGAQLGRDPGQLREWIAVRGDEVGGDPDVACTLLDLSPQVVDEELAGLRHRPGRAGHQLGHAGPGGDVDDDQPGVLSPAQTRSVRRRAQRGR